MTVFLAYAATVPSAQSSCPVRADPAALLVRLVAPTRATPRRATTAGPWARAVARPAAPTERKAVRKLRLLNGADVSQLDILRAGSRPCTPLSFFAGKMVNDPRAGILCYRTVK